MEHNEVTLQSLADSQDVHIGYYDQDIVIVDSIQKFTEASNDSHTTTMSSIMICTAGRVQAMMNGETIAVHRNQIGIFPSHMNYSDVMVSPEFEMKAMFLSDKILQTFLHEKMSLWNEIMYVHHQHVFDVDREGILFYAHYYEMLRLCFKNSEGDHPYMQEIIQSILRSGILGICGNLKKMSSRSVAATRAKSADGHFQRFLDLLNTSQVKHRPVEEYANELCITSKYLTTICKDNSGKTANEWITEFVMEDIRYYLKQTNYSIKEICNRTGFPNPSFFGRYVKKHFGMTPKELQAQ